MGGGSDGPPWQRAPRRRSVRAQREESRAAPGGRPAPSARRPSAAPLPSGKRGRPAGSRPHRPRSQQLVAPRASFRRGRAPSPRSRREDGAVAQRGLALSPRLRAAVRHRSRREPQIRRGPAASRPRHVDDARMKLAARCRVSKRHLLIIGEGTSARPLSVTGYDGSHLTRMESEVTDPERGRRGCAECSRRTSQGVPCRHRAESSGDGAGNEDGIWPCLKQ